MISTMWSGAPKFAAAVLVVGLATALAANATRAVAQQTYPPEVEAQCRDDYFRHCSSYALGSTELRRCMESKGKSLAPNCQQALKDAGFTSKSSKSK